MKLLFYLPVLLLASLSSQAVENPAKQQTDLRVIVDISGSMKKTDPNNLRRPAVRLLAGMIPDNSRSGIWNFGQYVNMAVKIGNVDEAWRESARKESEKISSIGQFTNIEEALRKAMFDWNKPDSRFNRNLILLTDGHVDVSKDDQRDRQSRDRIISEILPRLEKAGVKVHTIALSNDVDEELLSTLSAYTDGLFQKVSSADDLQAMFMQMLQQSARLDTLPLLNNRFNVDQSVNDMTLLVFNNDEKNPTKIITPAKQTWDIKRAQEKNDKVKWYQDEGYDLVTIKNPQPGQWKILAPKDENNRVVVATNLKLATQPLPGYLMIGDKVKVSAQLLEDGNPLADKRLLSKFSFGLAMKQESGTEKNYDLVASSENENLYQHELPPIFTAGNYELIIQAKSKTVQRELRHQFTVYSNPADIKIEKQDGKYRLRIKPHGNLLRPDSVQVDVMMNDQQKFELKQEGDEWYVDLGDEYSESMFALNITANRADGKKINVSYNRVLQETGSASELSMLDDKTVKADKEDIEKEKLAKEQKAQQEKLAPDENQAGKDGKSNKQKDANTGEDESGVNWTIVIISIAGGNILLIIAFVGGYLMLKRRKAKLAKMLHDEVAEDILDDEPAVEDKKQEEPTPVTFDVPNDSEEIDLADSDETKSTESEDNLSEPAVEEEAGTEDKAK